MGTARHAGDLAWSTGWPLDERLDRFDREAPPERRLLVAAGSWATYAAAGRVATTVEPLAPAAPETRPEATAAVGELLRELLSATPHDLLVEALERVTATGCVVPPALLPELLAVRDLPGSLLSRVIGERGHWLAALTGQGERLSAPVAAPPHQTWQEGSHAERVAVLAERRREAPAEAREWLAASWAQEKSEHRLAFLALFDESLVADDAPFLEQALADRAASVRAAAARLLCRLPATATRERLTARADALLSYAPTANEGGLLSRVRRAVGAGAAGGCLDVTPPATFDPLWEREGLAAKPPKGVGERAHWLAQVLALVDPAHWEERFAAAPAVLLRAAGATEWAHALLVGWSAAAGLHGRGEWMAALWDAWRALPLDPGLKAETAARERSMLALLGRMPRPMAEQKVLDALAEPPERLPAAVDALLEAVPRPWGGDFGGRLVARLQPGLEAAAAQYWTPGSWFELLKPLALRLDPASFEVALALERDLAARQSLSPAYQTRLDEFREAIRLRARIHEEIA